MAKQPMLKFVDRERAMPEKRTAGDRNQDYNEIYNDFADDKAKDQAARCSQCGVPYCSMSGCPLQNNIPDWLRLTAVGRLDEAYQISQATNNLPEICGRICPQDRLCEGICVIEQSGHGTVTIGAVEKYLTDTAWEQGWVKARLPYKTRSEKVAIIGSGPAGLAAADELSAKGFQVSVFERQDRAGGLLTYGIPGFKLEKEVVLRRVALLEEQGVKFILNTEIGKDVTFETLRQDFDAVLIATGVYQARALTGPGSGMGGIVQAIDFLKASNRANMGDNVEEHHDGSLFAKGKNVVVVGGGDTAMDCVRTAIRQGAKSVKCLYRRDEANMPGSVRETANAKEEGVEFKWLTLPKSFDGKDKVETVRVARMELGAPDASGRRSPIEVEGADFSEPADLVITALGFEPENLHELFAANDLELTRWNTVKAVTPHFKTSLEGVFAAGDIVRGASLVVWAIKEGRDAAEGIAQYLQQKSSSATAAQ